MGSIRINVDGARSHLIFIVRSAAPCVTHRLTSGRASSRSGKHVASIARVLVTLTYAQSSQRASTEHYQPSASRPVLLRFSPRIIAKLVAYDSHFRGTRARLWRVNFYSISANLKKGFSKVKNHNAVCRRLFQVVEKRIRITLCHQIEHSAPTR